METRWREFYGRSPTLPERSRARRRKHAGWRERRWAWPTIRRSKQTFRKRLRGGAGVLERRRVSALRAMASWQVSGWSGCWDGIVGVSCLVVEWAVKGSLRTGFEPVLGDFFPFDLTRMPGMNLLPTCQSNHGEWLGWSGAEALFSLPAIQGHECPCSLQIRWVRAAHECDPTSQNRDVGHPVPGCLVLERMQKKIAAAATGSYTVASGKAKWRFRLRIRS